jgi:hypothetical protein
MLVNTFKKSSRLVALATSALLALGLTACSTSPGDTNSASPEATDRNAALLVNGIQGCVNNQTGSNIGFFDGDFWNVKENREWSTGSGNLRPGESWCAFSPSFLPDAMVKIRFTLPDGVNRMVLFENTIKRNFMYTVNPGLGLVYGKADRTPVFETLGDYELEFGASEYSQFNGFKAYPLYMTIRDK